MTDLVLGPDDPTSADVRVLVDAHLAFAHRNSPPEDVHALDPARLTDESVSLFSARRGGVLLGVGALRRIDPSHAEIKSMHTAREARRHGVGRAMLDHLLGVARSRGCRRVSLETGSTATFAAARRLYQSAGFRPCPPFGSYRPSPNSVFMTLELSPSVPSGATACATP